MNKIILRLLIFTIAFVSCYSSFGQKIYQWDEIDITVNNFHLNSEYIHTEILSLIGTPDDVVDGGQQVIDEFGYNTHEYRYGSSYVLIRDNKISDVFVNDDRLSINGIKVGDLISVAKSEFIKYNQRDNFIVIYYNDFPLTFFYDSNNFITKITYVVSL